MTTTLFAAVGSGGLVGFTLGLVGGGGSILATPLLLYVVGVTQPHVAIGTGALAVAANALANFGGHALKGHVWWRCALVFAALGSLGALAGSTLGKSIDGTYLLFFFGLLMMVVGGLMVLPRHSNATAVRPVNARMCAMTAAVAVAAGAASGFFGIGGGFLIVPGLILATGMPTINAIGTSLLAVAAFGLATAFNYALSGMVDWQLAAEFIGGGIGGGLVGTLAATRLASYRNALNRTFAALIFVVASYVVYTSIGQIALR
ncbi:sulfite exporter TauE/SafE family protein [Mesorhizobium qingshengii]|uniref:Probable membrane transporter protein n=1 Tax=Mesorhizobium qingshengii TaxID=1165689 RepID=A0A1G5ZPU9_9HYPH|nr:sulfite exporter TauE/SafE family protein [Mesorhizobium qingshengii]SDA96516.1 hypothetical protein SAMN02927914_05657 [Mesorhizobium qingshengii]